MNEPELVLDGVDEGTLPYVEALLAENDLPNAAVRSTPEWFSVAYRDGEPVAVGGVEPRGTDGLLRSIAVEEPARGNGIGSAVCASLEAEALSAGIETLYLLTTDAAGFFATLGYEETERANVPRAVRTTEQFAERCPASATCMRKSLGR